MSDFKLYALLILGVVLGIFGLRSYWSRVAELKLELKDAEAKNKSITVGRGIENEVRNLDDDALRESARRWVRGNKTD